MKFKIEFYSALAIYSTGCKTECLDWLRSNHGLLTFFFKYTKYNQERTWTCNLNYLNFDVETVLPTECCLYSKCRILWLLLAFRMTVLFKSVLASVQSTECRVAFTSEGISMYQFSTWNTEKVTFFPISEAFLHWVSAEYPEK